MHARRSHLPSLQRGGVSMVSVIVGIAAVGVTLLILVPGATRNASGAARRTQCRNNLRTIHFALENYAADYGQYPPLLTVDADGRPLHSWRTLLLPYLEESSLFAAIDLSKPWDDSANQEAQTLSREVHVYQCPESALGAGMTTYLAVPAGGPSASLPARQRFAHALEPGESAESSSRLVVEVPRSDAVPWMRPVDLAGDPEDTVRGMSELPHRYGASVLFADGHIATESAETLFTADAADLTGGP